MPPMRIAPIARWGTDVPTVPAGLKAAAFARGLAHPRQIYVLPNGDVLVAESSGPAAPVNRPKDVIMGFIKGLAGAGEKGANRITLLPGQQGHRRAGYSHGIRRPPDLAVRHGAGRP